MDISSGILQIGDIEIKTLRKDIKNIHLGVYPPNGRVRIAAPLKTTEESIRLFAISKISWIKKQKNKFINQNRQTQRDYITGESHYFLGKRYLLNVIEQSSPQRIEINKKTHIDLYIHSESNRKKKERILENWYRKELQKTSLPIIKRLEKELKVNVQDFKIRKMKTKWGACNSKDNRIWVNLELAKKPLRCLEYILVHEIIHFFERTHNNEFIKKMDQVLPNWRSIRNELNNSPLGYCVWND